MNKITMAWEMIKSYAQMQRKGQAGIIMGVIGLVVLVIGLVIADDVISAQTWNSTLTDTVAGYLVPVGILGGLVAAAALAIRRRR